jgi:uncharacterized protein (TIGR00369 family)
MTADSVLSRLPTPNSSADWIKAAWRVLQGLPNSYRLYSRFMTSAIPYAASVDAQVIELSPGFVRVDLKDERRTRNHLGTVHAIALAHVAELAANLAVTHAMAEKTRFIVSELQVRYLKKAYGTISATCRCPASFGIERQEVVVEVKMHDSEGSLVAEAAQKVMIGPMPE